MHRLYTDLEALMGGLLPGFPPRFPKDHVSLVTKGT